MSLGLTILLVRQLRLSAEVFATTGQPLPRTGGATLGASVLLIVLCLMLLLSERKRRPHPLSAFLKPSNENEKP